jgi:hypothetical protein
MRCVRHFNLSGPILKLDCLQWAGVRIVATMLMAPVTVARAEDQALLGNLLSRTQVNFDRAAGESLLRSLQSKSGQSRSGLSLSLPPLALPTSLPTEALPAAAPALSVPAPVTATIVPEPVISAPVIGAIPVAVPAETMPVALPVAPPVTAIAPAVAPPLNRPSDAPLPLAVPPQIATTQPLQPAVPVPLSNSRTKAAAASELRQDAEAGRAPRKPTRAQCNDILARAQLGELTKDDRDLLRLSCR